MYYAGSTEKVVDDEDFSKEAMQRRDKLLKGAIERFTEDLPVLAEYLRHAHIGLLFVQLMKRGIAFHATTYVTAAVRSKDEDTLWCHFTAYMEKETKRSISTDILDALAQLWGRGIRKRCNVCKEMKVLSMFSKYARSKDGYNYTCLECERRRARKSEKKKRLAGPALPRKVCGLCEKNKTLDQYTKNPNEKDGLRRYCKACEHQRHKQRKDSDASSNPGESGGNQEVQAMQENQGV